MPITSLLPTASVEFMRIFSIRGEAKKNISVVGIDL